MKVDRRSMLKGMLGGLATIALSSPTRTYAKPYTEKTTSLIEKLIINAGVGGNNTVDLLARVERDCLAYQPRLTILMVGTNDLNSVKHVPLPDYEKNLEKLVKAIKGSGSEVVLMSILPVFEADLLTRHPASFYQPEGVYKRRAQINAVIKNIAKAKKVHFLDIGHRFDVLGKIGNDRESLLQNQANSSKRDGIHPTANGYRFMALAIYDYITAKQLPTEKIVCFGDSITKGDGTITNESYPAYLNKLLHDEN